METSGALEIRFGNSFLRKLAAGKKFDVSKGPLPSDFEKLSPLPGRFEGSMSNFPIQLELGMTRHLLHQKFGRLSLCQMTNC